MGIDVALNDVCIVRLYALPVIMQIRLRQLLCHIGIAVRACAVQIAFQLGNFRHGIFQLGFCVVDHIGDRLDSIFLRQNRVFSPLLLGKHPGRVLLIAGGRFRLLDLLCFLGFERVQQFQRLFAQINRVAVWPAAVTGVYLLNNLLQTGVLHLPHRALHGALYLRTEHILTTCQMCPHQ